MARRCSLLLMWCFLPKRETAAGKLGARQRSHLNQIIIIIIIIIIINHNNNATSDIDKARLLAVKANHGSECIFALPISACGVRISYEAVRIAIGLRSGLNICEPNSCPCGGVVDAKGMHGLS